MSDMAESLTKELDAAAKQYGAAYDQLLACRATTELAHLRLTRAKELAQLRIPRVFAEWLMSHPDLRYLGCSVGEACRIALLRCGSQTAHELVAELQQGGCDLLGKGALRQVKTALVNLSGVTKLEGGRYSAFYERGPHVFSDLYPNNWQGAPGWCSECDEREDHPNHPKKEKT